MIEILDADRSSKAMYKHNTNVISFSDNDYGMIFVYLYERWPLLKSMPSSLVSIIIPYSTQQKYPQFVSDVKLVYSSKQIIHLSEGEKLDTLQFAYGFFSGFNNMLVPQFD